MSSTDNTTNVTPAGLKEVELARNPELKAQGNHPKQLEEAP